MRRAAIVTAARAWKGTPYRHQAALRGAGCDCLGLIRGIWAELGGTVPEVPPYGADWRRLGTSESLWDAALRLLRPGTADEQPGQVLLFAIGRDGLARHCGVAAGDGRFIHAQEGMGVVEAPLGEGWQQRLAGRFDFPEVED